MNWSSAIRGAQLGMAVAAMLGAIPLIVGCLLREYKKAGIAFAGTLLAGTLGGLYAAIAAMTLAMATFSQRKTQPEERGTQWARMATKTDKLWWTVAGIWVGLSLLGTMLLSAFFAEPLVLIALGYDRKDSDVKIIEPMMFFGSMAIGAFVGLWGASLICRNLLSAATHQNLERDMRTSTLNRSRTLAWFVRCYYGLLLAPTEN